MTFRPSASLLAALESCSAGSHALRLSMGISIPSCGVHHLWTSPHNPTHILLMPPSFEDPFLPQKPMTSEPCVGTRLVPRRMGVWHQGKSPFIWNCVMVLVLKLKDFRCAAAWETYRRTAVASHCHRNCFHLFPGFADQAYHWTLQSRGFDRFKLAEFLPAEQA